MIMPPIIYDTENHVVKSIAIDISDLKGGNISEGLAIVDGTIQKINFKRKGFYGGKNKRYFSRQGVEYQYDNPGDIKNEIISKLIE